MKEYIETAKKRQNVSQNKLAKMIGITGGALSQIANGSPASDETIVKLARLAGVAPETILIEYKMSKPMTPEVKSMWERIAGHAAIWAVATIGTCSLFIANIPQYILCKIMQASE